MVTNAPKIQDIISSTGWRLEEKRLFVERALLSTQRKGIENVIKFLNDTDFYYAPASTIFHSNHDNGLLNHSIVVYILGMMNKERYINCDSKLEEKLNDNSIRLTTLLHDICKCCFYTKEVKWKKDDSSQWQSYIGYNVNDVFPIGHGEKSVIMLQNLGLELQPDEMLAIRYHMGMWGDGGSEMKYSQNNAIHYSPLVPLLQISDFEASVIFEPTIKN